MPLLKNLLQRNPRKSLGLQVQCHVLKETLADSLSKVPALPTSPDSVPLNLFFSSQDLSLSYTSAAIRCKLLNAGTCLSFTAVNCAHSNLAK